MTRKTIGGMPSSLFKLFLLIALVGLVAAVLSGCTPSAGCSVESSSDSQSYESNDFEPESNGWETEAAEAENNDSATYVEVPGTSRKGDIFDFSYTTEGGTELTCIVYDRDGPSRAAGGLFCFEEEL